MDLFGVVASRGSHNGHYRQEHVQWGMILRQHCVKIRLFPLRTFCVQGPLNAKPETPSMEPVEPIQPELPKKSSQCLSTQMTKYCKMRHSQTQSELHHGPYHLASSRTISKALNSSVLSKTWIFWSLLAKTCMNFREAKSETRQNVALKQRRTGNCRFP